MPDAGGRMSDVGGRRRPARIRRRQGYGGRDDGPGDAPYHLGQLVQPIHQPGTAPPVFQTMIQLLSNLFRQPRNFSMSCFHIIPFLNADPPSSDFGEASERRWTQMRAGARGSGHGTGKSRESADWKVCATNAAHSACLSRLITGDLNTDLFRGKTYRKVLHFFQKMRFYVRNIFTNRYLEKYETVSHFSRVQRCGRITVEKY